MGSLILSSETVFDFFFQLHDVQLVFPVGMLQGVAECAKSKLALVPFGRAQLRAEPERKGEAHED